MKVLVQSDDFGFTKAITLGILESIDNGIVRNTGLFVNMGESSELAASEIAARPHVCFGIDFNISSGKCVSDPSLIPNLVDNDGYFIRSTEKYKLLNNNQDVLWPYDEVKIEIQNQYNKYIELVGKPPEYFHTHSIHEYAHEYVRAIRDFAYEVSIPYSHSIKEKNNVYNFRGRYNQKPFPIEEQIHTNVLQYYKDNIQEIYGKEVVSFGSHCGFIDAEVFKWSTYSLIRCKDLEAFTSDFFKEWIDNNSVELITYRDLKVE